MVIHYKILVMNPVLSLWIRKYYNTAYNTNKIRFLFYYITKKYIMACFLGMKCVI